MAKFVLTWNEEAGNAVDPLTCLTSQCSNTLVLAVYPYAHVADKQQRVAALPQISSIIVQR